MRLKNKKPVSANIAGEKALTLTGWSSRQFEAKRRGVPLSTLLADSGVERTRTVKIELPVAFLECVERELQCRGIPRSHLEQGLVNAILAVQLTADSELWGSYVYTSRQTAAHAALRDFLLHPGTPSVALSYRGERGTANALFRNSSVSILAA